MASIAAAWQRRSAELGLTAGDTVQIVKALFNQIALTPYTGLVERLLEFLGQLVHVGLIAEQQWADLVSFMLRQLARHLNAFDLIVFHNRGANYPDALLLQSLLDVYLPMIDRHPEWFIDHVADAAHFAHAKAHPPPSAAAAVAIRLQYAGHPVPDVPTSPGENARVMADPALRVAAEQLLQVGARRRQLFTRGGQLPAGAAQAFAPRR